jgi:hypothetical protein
MSITLSSMRMAVARSSQLVVVQLARPCAGQVDRAQVADGDLVIAGVERDLGAQVGRVHHAHVLLRRAHVAGSLKVIQGWPVSNSMVSILRHRSLAGMRLNSLISPRSALAS